MTLAHNLQEPRRRGGNPTGALGIHLVAKLISAGDPTDATVAMS